MWWRCTDTAVRLCFSNIAHKSVWTLPGVVPKVNYVQHHEMSTTGNQSSTEKLTCYTYKQKCPYKHTSWRCVYKFIPAQKTSVIFLATCLVCFSMFLILKWNHMLQLDWSADEKIALKQLMWKLHWDDCQIKIWLFLNCPRFLKKEKKYF